MEFYYSTNKNVQLLVALLKAHGIKRIIASPGTTNLELIGSLQHDSFFEIYSCVDERSAAYMACGLASETKEPVVITCTEATASRNYYSGLTEAYHRKLPILAVTGLHNYNLIGHLEPQVIDRSISPNDSMKLKVNLPVIKDEDDIWESVIKINKAILELKRHGGGPVHINIPWSKDLEFSVKDLPNVRVIKRYFTQEPLPEINANKIAILVGSHLDWSTEETEAIDEFCLRYNAVVICDHTSKYYGKYRVQGTILAAQTYAFEVFSNIDLLIHLGEEFGDDLTIQELRRNVREVWRVNPDGEIRDTFRKLTNVFEMDEKDFFYYYIKQVNRKDSSYFKKFKDITSFVLDNIPELPFSSIYIASQIAPRLPKNSVIHLGVSDTIRAWNFFELSEGVRARSNTGCRGIDGCVSSLIGASLADKNKLFFGVFGDLTFFYDMNSLGNRHISNNIRIIVVNNDGGNIFRHTGHPSQRWLGFEKTNLFIAAAGHFGCKSPNLLKNFATNLGFEYLFASNKIEFEKNVSKFVSPDITEKPILFEIFTEPENDNKAFDIMSHLYLDLKGKAKVFVKTIIGDQGTELAKSILKKLKDK